MNPNALLHCRHHIQAAHAMSPLHEAGMENKIQVVKGPFNILQLAQDKRTQFSSPGLLTASSIGSKSSPEAENPSVSLVILIFVPPSDTTVTVSIAAVPNYAAVKTEVPSHSFSLTIPNNCSETDSHVGIFERQLAHSGVQCGQARTPPDSTFSESFKDGSQEVCVSIPLLFLKPC